MNMAGLIGMIQQAAGNMPQMLARAGVPQNIQNDPNAIMQHLMNSGQLTQEQYNRLRDMAHMVENNPQYRRMTGR